MLKNNIGFLFILGFDGKSIPDWIARFADEFGLGGVVLYERNFSDENELKELICHINTRLAPLFVAVDQEGGDKRRLKVEPFENPIEMGKRMSSKEIFEIYRSSAIKLLGFGFNLNFAPCCDIAVDGSYIGKRSFGTDPIQVGEAVYSAIKGMSSSGLFTTAKHFPGLGRCKIDPHRDLPVLDLSISDVLNFELIPFRYACLAGVDFIMSTHIVVKGIDDLPATFSNAVVGLLSRELGFDGVVITDDILMGALSSYTVQDRIDLSFCAGHHMVLISSGGEWIFELMKKIRPAQLDNKLEKIFKKKEEKNGTG